MSSLQSSSLRRCEPVEESSKLLQRANDLLTNVLHGAEETERSLREEAELFQALLQSTQSWVGDLRLIVESPLGERAGIQSPVEQRLHRAQVRQTSLPLTELLSLSTCLTSHILQHI